MSTNLKIAKASAILIVINILGFMLSLLKEVLSAKYFGITKDMDAFYLAITVPNLIINIFIITFNAIFIPV